MDVLEIKRQGKQTRLKLAPVLDISEARNLYALLDKALTRKPPLVLDASKVERIDTAAMQVLAVFCRTVHENGQELIWDAPSINLKRAVELVGFHTVLGLPI